MNPDEISELVRCLEILKSKADGIYRHVIGMIRALARHYA